MPCKGKDYCNCDGSCWTKELGGKEPWKDYLARTWVWWLILVYVFGIFASCTMIAGKAIGEEIPATQIAAKWEVDNQYTYLFYRGDARPADARPYEQNCLGYARAYIAALQARGSNGVMFQCETPDGIPHVFVWSYGMILDNRYTTVVPHEKHNCR